MATRKRRPSLKPRKQPTQARSSETVNVILEAAARILETRGFAGYTTNAVAERAGVSIGSLYQYFPNKDALTAALIDRETVPLVSALAGAAQTKSCMTGFDRLIDAAVAHQMRRPELARLLDFEERRLPLSHRDQRVADHITDLVIALFKHGDAPMVADPMLAAADVMAIVRGMVDAAGERGERDAEALARRVRKATHGYLFA
jgi:AcrR family transcriptional regulator